MREAEFQAQVVDLCKLLNLRYYHPYDSRRSVSGYPDLTIVGKGGVIFAELKTEKGRISKEQAEWLQALDEAGQEAYVWRPADLPLIARRLTRLRRGYSFRQEADYATAGLDSPHRGR